MGALLFLLAIWVVLAVWSSSMARKRGRSPSWGFLWGFIFGLLAILGYAIAGKTEAKEQEDFNKRQDAYKAKK